MSMTTELIERLRQHADTFEKSGFAVDGLIKDYREAADTIQLLSEKLRTMETVVLCKDCKHLYQDGECPLRLWKYHVENDFCSYGEKM